MKTSEIIVRDPFVLLHEGTYYLYGTRSATCWGKADGFDCYTSKDLNEWEGPFTIFHRPEGFFADCCYWAPECYAVQDSFFLITTLKGEERKKGIYALRAETPLGPFVPWGEALTPKDWNCIDGTLWFENGEPWLVFSHSFEDVPSGDMCCVPLKADLSGAAGEPQVLFSAPEAPWARPVPFAKAEFGMEGDVYFTDGPCLFRLPELGLCMAWSSWGNNGYAVGVAVSRSGTVRGPWTQQAAPIFPENGGHGMVFQSKEGALLFALHFPNDKLREHPRFMRLTVRGGEVGLEDFPQPEGSGAKDK